MFEHVAKPASAHTSVAQLFDDLRQDLHYAARQLRRAPAFAALVIATLAIGIGANATMVGVIDRLLFRAPPELRDPDNLSRVVFQARSPTGELDVGSSVDYPTYLQLKNEVNGFSALAGARLMTVLPLVSASNPAAEANVSLVTANYFETLGALPSSGRFFGARDGFPITAQMGGPALAVISYGFWQREYGGESNLVGKSITVGKLSYTIVGIAPPGFRGIESKAPDVWVPITVALEVEWPTSMIWARSGPYMKLVGRVGRGASRAQINAQGTSVMRVVDALERDTTSHTHMIAAPVEAARGPDAPREVKITLWLGGVSALVLLIVCANVANLLLGRAFTRRREIAVRLALGAGRGRLARQLLAEAVLLSAIGGVGGLALAAGGGRLLQERLVADISNAPIIDARLLIFTLVVTLGTGVLVSLVPMVQSTSPNLSNGLRTSNSGSASGGLSVRSVLLTSQAALCVILLVGAGLFAQSLRRVEALDVGVDLDHTIEVPLYGMYNLPIPSSQAFMLVDEIKARVLALPGVKRAGLANGLLGGGHAVGIKPQMLTFEDVFPRGSWNHAPLEAAVDSGMFTTLGARSLRGRDFNAADRAGARRVTILNSTLAKRVFPNSDAVGQCVTLPSWGYDKAVTDNECVEVIGVISGYYRMSLTERDEMVAFVPLAQRRTRDLSLNLYVSTRGPANEMIQSVTDVVHSVRPDLRRVKIQSMRSRIEPDLRPWRLAATMFVMFGVVALLIAMIGLYAVVSFSVAQRTNEIAVRLALGARTRHITAAVSTGSLYAVSTGLGIGVLVAILVRRFIGPLLFQTSANDPFVIGGVAVVLFGVAVIAMIIPLVRALRVNPSEVMRGV